MGTEEIASHRLAREDFEKIKRLGVRKDYAKDDLIFSDGDTADYIYFIESGHVYIYIEKFTHKEEICTMGAGEYFGEMAFFSGERRSASAAALLDSTLLRVDKAAFLDLIGTDRDIAGKINANFARRNAELTFKEELNVAGRPNGAGDLKIGIKGDPSMRETAFTRERYDSVVDKILVELQPRLYDMLLNRCVYEIFVHCNSGEVHVRTVYDPFNGEIHPAVKLLNVAYVERHFPALAYEDKATMMKRLYESISGDAAFGRLPAQLGDRLRGGFDGWTPVGRRELASTLSRLSLLRRIPNFYLRNFTIGMVRDAIRLQFNCDGTHIVNAHGFQAFLEENLAGEELDAVPAVERRKDQRRNAPGQGERSRYAYGERRSPPGRRREDWLAILSAGPTRAD